MKFLRLCLCSCIAAIGVSPMRAQQTPTPDQQAREALRKALEQTSPGPAGTKPVAPPAETLPVTPAPAAEPQAPEKAAKAAEPIKTPLDTKAIRRAEDKRLAEEEKAAKARAKAEAKTRA